MNEGLVRSRSAIAIGDVFQGRLCLFAHTIRIQYFIIHTYLVHDEVRRGGRGIFLRDGATHEKRGDERANRETHHGARFRHHRCCDSLSVTLCLTGPTTARNVSGRNRTERRLERA